MAPKIIDMHAHCPERPGLDAEYTIFDEGYYSRLAAYSKQMQKNAIVRSLVYILDCRAVASRRANYPGLALAILIDFRKKNAIDFIRSAKKSGFIGFKILTYEQKVTVKDYRSILMIARAIEKQDMFLTICSTFGSKYMYDHDALRLAAYLIQQGYKAPLILAHAGGSRVREAFLIADDAPNVYLDTSFTLSYWRGSSVIDDIAYVVHRLPGRVFFGSDAPNISLNQAIDDARQIKSLVSEQQWNNYLFTNALTFIKKYE